MKTLIVYYTRTGTNEKLAQIIQAKLNCDMEKIFSKTDYSGIFGYLKGGKAAIKKRTCPIGPLKFNPKDYDLTIILAPFWAGLVPPPIRAYLAQNQANFKDVAFISVSGGGEETKLNKNALSDFEAQINKKPVFAVLLKQEEVRNNTYAEKLDKFLNLNS